MTEPRCPNCGGGDTDELNIHDELWCRECGTWWWAKNPDEPHVPRRSQPAEVLELPDAPGTWHDCDDGRWFILACQDDGGNLFWHLFVNGRRYTHITSSRVLEIADVQPGRYVKAVPPIVPGPVDENDIDEVCTRAEHAHNENEATHYITQAIRLLADDLERLRRAERGKE